MLQSPTKSPFIRNDDLDDLNFKVSKKKQTNQTRDKNNLMSTDSWTEMPIRFSSEPTFKIPLGNRTIGNLTDFDEPGSQEESWVGEETFFLLDMHPDLGDPIEQLGIEIEDDNDDNVTDFIQRFGEKLLWDKGVNVTQLEEADLRCGKEF